MAGRKRNAPSSRGSAKAGGSRPKNPIPNIYREMLSEARSTRSTRSTPRPPPEEPPEPPPKRQKRPGEKTSPKSLKSTPKKEAKPPKEENHNDVHDDDDDDDDIEFEDVAIPAPTVQTMRRDDSDSDSDEDEDAILEELGVAPSSAVPASRPSEELNLNLTTEKAVISSNRAAERKKLVGREEMRRRGDVHKVHLLCLLAHVERRNRWCNDPEVQRALRPLLTTRITGQLNPRPNLIQFGRSESLKKGLQEASAAFKSSFKITERGLRRALWPEDEEQLKDYKLPDDAETTFEKDDFLEAARALEGSRDVGAQLFCALLRCAGVKTRLACSLQPLACVPGAPTLPKQRKQDAPKLSKGQIYAAAMAQHESAPSTSSPRRRLGHPLAAAYHVPSMAAPPSPVPVQLKKRIRESPFPVYWVEVFDAAYQKWHPVDPIVTDTQWRPRALEPPASDRENYMSYVVAFEDDATARDVTRRYTKAYNAKTKRMRIDGVNVPANRGSAAAIENGGRLNAGEMWWRRALRRYRRRHGLTDADQIELNELAAEEAKEPMPRNIADFKDHPVYALERHLRRHEVLLPDAQPSGTVSAGSKAPLERVFRRRDVRLARSRDKWYRLGRLVLPGEVAVKVLPKRARRRSGFDEEEDDDNPDSVGLFGDEVAGTPLYTLDQTELYQPPPVVDGRVPKNRFKNIDVYVPSMVPRGGVHIVHDRAAHAAFILGVDYAPALTGFQFKGNKGTAVLTGVVIPEESKEGVLAVIEGLENLEAEMEQERRSRQALRLWSRFLKGLRIRERIYAGVDEAAEEREEREEQERKQSETVDKGKGKGIAHDVDDTSDDDRDSDAEMAEAASDVSEVYYMEEEEEGQGGGGFFVGDEDDEGDGEGGGFVVEDGDQGGGGFILD